jgi:two-component system, OmpR family, sensor kinase
VDSLVGQLLASSRLEFDTIERRGLDARALATSALERAGLDPALVRADLADTAIAGDPTLLARALANLIENAQTHGGGVTALVITTPPDSGSERLAFEVHDHGPGFADTEPARVFDPFYRGKPTHAAAEHAALGLGLALVRRIARAHGGDAWARNREAPGGACVGFSLRRHDPGEPGRDT